MIVTHDGGLVISRLQCPLAGGNTYLLPQSMVLLYPKTEMKLKKKKKTLNPHKLKK